MHEAPRRLRDIHTCCFWYQGRELDPDLQPFVRADQALVVTCPDSCPGLVNQFHRGGGAVLLYVSIYKAPVIPEVPDDLRKWEGGSPFRAAAETNPFWQSVNLVGHPDWILRKENGQPRRPFDLDQYMAGWYQVTPLVPGYRQAVLQGIRRLAADGRFAGIFLDNVLPHDFPSTILADGQIRKADMAGHVREFKHLIESMHAAGHEAGREGFLLMTNGVNDLAIQNVADIMLMESFIYSWAWATPSMTDDQAQAALQEYRPLRDRGGRPAVLPYLGFSGHPIADDARHIRRLADQENAIYSDFFTLVRPSMVEPGARRCASLQRSGDPWYYPEVDQALRNMSPGDPAAAREIYRLG